MNYLLAIQKEFLKYALGTRSIPVSQLGINRPETWWDDLSYEEQRAYLQRHPASHWRNYLKSKPKLTEPSTELPLPRPPEYRDDDWDSLTRKEQLSEIAYYKRRELQR